LLGDCVVADPDQTNLAGGFFARGSANSLTPNAGAYISAKYPGLDRHFQIGCNVSAVENYFVRSQLSDGVFTATRTLWHNGNFNPALYAPINNPTFTGTVTLPIAGLKADGTIEFEADKYGAGWARGLAYFDGGTLTAGIGALGSAGTVNSLYMGWGATPWTGTFRVEVTSAKVSLYGLTVVESNQLQSKGAQESIRMQAPASADICYMSWYNQAGTRLGYIGNASAGNSDIYLNCDIGELRINRQGAARLITDADGCTLYGIPKVPTAAASVSGDQAASTAFVHAVVDEATGGAVFSMKKLTGTTAAAENGGTNIAHGLDVAKILGVQVLVQHNAVSGNCVPPEWTRSSGFQYSYSVSTTNVVVELHPTNSENILSKPIRIVVTYES